MGGKKTKKKKKKKKRKEKKERKKRNKVWKQLENILIFIHDIEWWGGG